jgi:hypothetical protein
MSGARVIPSLSADDDLFRRLEAQRAQRASARARVDVGVAQRASAIRTEAPWIPAGTAAALASAGFDANSPEFQQISQLAAKRKSKKGLGWHTLGGVVKAGGDALGVVGRAGDTVLGGVDEAVASAAKPVVRGAALGAQSLYEEAQGAVRNVASMGPAGAAIAGGVTAAALAVSAPISVPAAGIAAVAAGGAALGAMASQHIDGHARWEPQSSGGVTLERLLRGERVELGEGWLPNVDAGENPAAPDATWTIGEEQRRRASRVNIDGRALTPGRLLAAGITDPGSTASTVLSGLVDGSLALSRWDPASAIVKTAGNANRNRKLFVEAGGLLSSRPNIVPEAVDAWLAGTKGRALVEKLAGETDFYTIWRNTGRKLDVETANAIAKAGDEAGVLEVLRPKLGIDIREKPTYSTFRPFGNVRLAQAMPGHTIDLRDADQSVLELERWLQNAKAPTEMIADLTGRMADASTRLGRYGVLSEAMDATAEVLTEVWGVKPGKAHELTRLVSEANEDTRKFFTDAVGRNVNVPGLFIGDEAVGIPRPHLYAEFLNRALPMPDARDIRSAASFLAPILDNPQVKVGVAALDWVQGQWKRMALLRGAYTVRVVGEEQGRMAASGLDSLVSHPLSLIAWRLGHKGAEDVLGESFLYRDADEFVDGLDDFNKALNRQWAGWVDQNRPLPIWRNYTKGSNGYVDAWAGEITELAADPIAREVARSQGDINSVKDWFWGTGAQKVDDALTPGERYRLTMAEDAGGLASRQTADRYIDSIVERITVKTGGDTGLLDAIAAGHLDGEALRTGTRPSDYLRAYLDESADIGPDAVKGQMSLTDRGVAHWYDQATKWAFSELMGERTNNLSRSPTFKQYYWQRVEELVPFMDETAHASAIDGARAAGLDDIAERMARATSSGGLTLDHADFVAKGFALDTTRDLLYDLTERGQFFDAARLIFPFGEAWKELITRWSKLGVERPESIRRIQQVIVGARSDDAPGGGKHAGFFYENSNGEEVFAYPGTGWISDKLFGVPVPLTGRVGGLSLMTEVVPGVGPMVQFGAGALLPDKPEWDWMRDVVFPFGEPDVKQGTLESLLPAWVQKWRQAGLTPFAQDEGQWNSTVLDVARWLASSGDYDTSTQDGLTHLLDDARTKARAVYALRGAAQFFAPTAPSPEWRVADKDGQVHVAQELVEEYQALLQADYQTATEKMLDKYGAGIWLLLQGKTAEVTPAAPVTKEGGDWERANAGLVKRFPNVYGFFAPQGGDLDLTVYSRQLENDARVRITPEQGVRLANDRIANVIYQRAKDQLGPRPNKAQQTALRGLREALEARYEGFGDRSGIPEKVSVDTLVDNLKEAVADDRLADRPVTATIKMYLEARAAAEAAAQRAGLAPTGFRTSKQMAPMRTALRALGDALVAKDPSFGPVWDRVFDRELADEEDVTDGQ